MSSLYNSLIYVAPTRLAGLFAAVGISLFLCTAAARAIGQDAVPGQVLVGFIPSMAAADEAKVLADFGTVGDRIPEQHEYMVQLRQGLAVPDAIPELERVPGVRYAEPNGYMHGCAPPNDTYYSTLQYAPQAVHADLAWPLWEPAKQIIIAILDTGVDTSHPDLANKLVAGHNVGIYNVHTGDYTSYLDDNGHGTHCAGIAAAQINNGVRIAGIAGWNGQAGSTDTAETKIMPVKCSDYANTNTYQEAADGIDWAYQNGANIISISFGSTTFTSTVSDAISNAVGQGCLVVASAGNTASSAPFYPADDLPNNNYVISVAATDRSDTLASYSTFGPWVSVAGTGGTAADGIYSTVPTYSVIGFKNLSYDYDNATSMACPLVAGEAALIWSQRPDLTRSQLYSIITNNVSAMLPYGSNSI
ncbi:MAG TPA: S8 family serine peptidase, partial [Chthonomonadales bacterium]|nr:S8 family serine peptidase [Chthonomonadales bacterium]